MINGGFISLMSTSPVPYFVPQTKQENMYTKVFSQKIGRHCHWAKETRETTKNVEKIKVGCMGVRVRQTQRKEKWGKMRNSGWMGDSNYLRGRRELYHCTFILLLLSSVFPAFLVHQQLTSTSFDVAGFVPSIPSWSNRLLFYFFISTFPAGFPHSDATKDFFTWNYIGFFHYHFITCCHDCKLFWVETIRDILKWRFS